MLDEDFSIVVAERTGIEFFEHHRLLRGPGNPRLINRGLR
jgi:hypothetical protein